MGDLPITVFLVQHEREGEDNYNDVKVVGVYLTENDANEAIEHSKTLPGFRNQPENFELYELEMGKHYWVEGFGPIKDDHPEK